jgi:hypothetical protein
MTAKVAEGPVRRVGDTTATTRLAPYDVAKDPAEAADDDAALVPPQVSPKISQEHQLGSSLLEEESETVPQHTGWSSLLNDVSVLPVLPSINHPLEKSSVTIKGVIPSVIAARIQGALQRRSIAASYLSAHKVRCTSSTYVEFCIFLYRQDFEQDGIIVEIQRRDGFDVSYMADVHVILDAASGKDGKPPPQQGNASLPLFFEDQKEENCDDGDCHQFPMFLSQIRTCEKEEEVYLCLSSLASLSNESKVGPTAIQVSRQFLVSEKCKELRSKVFSLISPANNSITSRSSLQSMEILANVCSCTRGSSELLEPLFSANDFELSRHLVFYIENAPSNPHAAAYACIVFRRLVEERILTNITSSRLIAALSAAVSLGGEIHENLERQAGGCLSVMSG